MPYRPPWEGPFKAYTETYMRKNLWKVSRTCTLDDAMQEARIVFLDCTRRYSHVDNGAWFMSLYKVSLAGRMVDLAAADTRHRSVGHLMCDITREDQPDIDTMGELSNAGELLTALRQAPEEVRSVLYLMLNAPAEILELATQAWRDNGKNSAFGNTMLCRMLGMNKRIDLLEAVREYFEGRAV